MDILCLHGWGLYSVKILIISSINELKQVVDNEKADLLDIKLVDKFEIEDLKMNLANKKIYQLINKANNAKYYYNQIKD